jgi:hypothetical protein
LLTMSQTDAEYHMKRCVDSGLWQAWGTNVEWRTKED